MAELLPGANQEGAPDSMGWMVAGVRGRGHSSAVTELKSTGMRPHSREALPAVKTPWAIHHFKAGGQERQILRYDVGYRGPGSTGTASGERQLSNFPSQFGFSDEENPFKPYHMLTLLYKPHSDMKAYSVHNNRSTHTTCGLWAANKQFIKTKSISGNRRNFQSASTCLSFPLITSRYTLTNRLMQETGNEGTRHSLS